MTDTTTTERRADCPDHPGLATYSLSTGFCTCGRAHSRWITTPAPAARVETVEQRMERLRRECTVNETGEHTCMSDPEVEAHYAAFVTASSRGN